MKIAACIATLAFVSAAAGAQNVDVGTGDWSAIPEVQPRGLVRMADAQMDLIESVGASGRCNVPGLGREAVDLMVPFLIRFNSEGSVERIIMRDLSCPELEVALGAAVVHLARANEYRLRSGSPAGWYRSEISFANR